eukprot:4877317-Amphidinium_carterae.2
MAPENWDEIDLARWLVMKQMCFNGKEQLGRHSILGLKPLILVQETFLVSGSTGKTAFAAKAYEFNSFFVPARKAKAGRPTGGLAVLSRVGNPAVVPLGCWMHVIVPSVPLERGGRTLR